MKAEKSLRLQCRTCKLAKAYNEACEKLKASEQKINELEFDLRYAPAWRRLPDVVIKSDVMEIEALKKQFAEKERVIAELHRQIQELYDKSKRMLTEKDKMMIEMSRGMKVIHEAQKKEAKKREE